MQNRYSELHTVLDWCVPGRLGDRNQWKDYVESPLKEAQRKDATQQQLAIGRVCTQYNQKGVRKLNL
jgi:hypothetical protein